MHIYVAKKSFYLYVDRRHLPQNSFESRRGGLYIYETFQRGTDQKKEDYFKQPIIITTTRSRQDSRQRNGSRVFCPSGAIAVTTTVAIIRVVL
jgi:hypothetical protein